MAALETCCYLINMFLLVRVGIDKRISSPHEQLDLFQFCYLFSINSMPNGSARLAVSFFLIPGKAFGLGSWCLAGRSSSPSRSQMLSPKLALRVFPNFRWREWVEKIISKFFGIGWKTCFYYPKSKKWLPMFKIQKIQKTGFRWLRRGFLNALSHRKFPLSVANGQFFTGSKPPKMFPYEN